MNLVLTPLNCQKYKSEGHGMIILAGAEYGSGSSRDWAAKGPMLLVCARRFSALTNLCAFSLFYVMLYGFIAFTGCESCHSKKL